MANHWILDAQHRAVPADQATWARFFEDVRNRFVAKTVLPCGLWISTVFLGLDHSFGGEVPLLFESMVFLPDGDARFAEDDLPWPEMVRYADWAEAECGHIDLVEQVQSAVVARS